MRRVVTSITWPAPAVYFHLASLDLPPPLLHDPDPVRIVRRSGGTVTPGGGPLTSTGYQRCQDWQEQWLALPRQVTPAVIVPDGAVHVGADGLWWLAAIMAAAGALPGRERAVQPGPAASLTWIVLPAGITSLVNHPVGGCGRPTRR